MFLRQTLDHQFDHQTGRLLAQTDALCGTERVLCKYGSSSGARHGRSAISLAGKGSAVRIRHAPPENQVQNQKSRSRWNGFSVAGALPQNLSDPAGQVCLRTNPTGGDDDEAVQQASRHDLARALAPRYAHASRREKGQVLDEFCAMTGLTRKHALVLLGSPPAEQPVSNHRGRPPSYGPAEVALLRVCWAALAVVCSKRLAPVLPELLARLRYWH